MPRHLLTKKDSGELKFKITRLPSDDSFIHSQDKSVSSFIENCTMMLSDSSVADGHFGLFSSPKTMTSNTSPLSSSQSSSSSSSSHQSLSTSSPSKQSNGTVLGTLNHNTTPKTINKMSTDTPSVPSSYGVLGVKKNFLHRAFQWNFSPGKVYKEDESKSIDSVRKFESSSPPGKMDAQQNTCVNEIAISPGRGIDDIMHASTKIMSPPQITSTPKASSISTTDYNLMNKIKSPSKKVSLLKFSPMENKTENGTNLYSPGTNHFQNDAENKKPDKIKIHNLKNSPKSKIEIQSRKFASPVKQTSKQFPSVSSPRKLDYPSIPQKLCRQSVNTSSQEYFKDTVIPKIKVFERFQECNVSDNANKQDCPHRDELSQQENDIEPRSNDTQSSQHLHDDEKEHRLGCPQDSPGNPIKTPIATKQQTQTNTHTPTASKTLPTSSQTISAHDKDTLPKSVETSTATAKTESTATGAEDKDKMYFHPYFYPSGVPIPTVSPHFDPHPHPHLHNHPHFTSHPLTPAIHLLNQNDSGYDTPGTSFRSNNRSNTISSISLNPGSNLSVITNGSLPIIPSPPSGGYLPTRSTSPPPPVSMLGAGLHPSFYTSTPLYDVRNTAYTNALLRNGHNEIMEKGNPHPFQVQATTTPPSSMINQAVMQQMAYLASVSSYPPYALAYPNPHNSAVLTQQTPLDLSASEEAPTSKPFRKKLFGATATSTATPSNSDSAKERLRKEERKRNPFGINRILGVEASPVKIEIPCTEHFGEGPSTSPSNVRSTNRKRRHSATSSSNEENHPEEGTEQCSAPKKKKSRDRPPMWGEEIPETVPEFGDCPEKAMFCNADGTFVAPDIPGDHESQQAMKASLLTLFKNSNLPPVPMNLRTNLFGLRFYPKMKTMFQAQMYRDTSTLKTSYGGLAFDNFKAIDDNSVIDGMLQKRGDLYYCLSKKCIDPMGTYCTFTATSLGKMRRHVKNHLPDKKWVCAFCRTQMTDQTDMARHGTTHTLLRPFPCENCGKAFSQKVTLVNHIQKTHKIEVPEELSKDRYTCRQCGVHFKESQREECEEHLRRYHFDKEFLTLKKRKRFPFQSSTESP